MSVIILDPKEVREIFESIHKVIGDTANRNIFIRLMVANHDAYMLTYDKNRLTEDEQMSLMYNFLSFEPDIIQSIPKILAKFKTLIENTQSRNGQSGISIGEKEMVKNIIFHLIAHGLPEGIKIKLRGLVYVQRLKDRKGSTRMKLHIHLYKKTTSAEVNQRVEDLKGQIYEGDEIISALDQAWLAGEAHDHQHYIEHYDSMERPRVI